MTLKDQKKAAEAEAGRELILMILEESDEYLAPSDIGEQLGITGYSAGQLLRRLLEEDKVKRVGSGPGKYMFGKLDNTKEEAAPIPQSERWLVAWKIDGRGYGDVLTNKEDAKAKAKELSKELPGAVLFVGKATKRICNVITETDM